MDRVVSARLAMVKVSNPDFTRQADMVQDLTSDPAVLKKKRSLAPTGPKKYRIFHRRIPVEVNVLRPPVRTRSSFCATVISC